MYFLKKFPVEFGEDENTTAADEYIRKTLYLWRLFVSEIADISFKIDGLRLLETRKDLLESKLKVVFYLNTKYSKF